MGTQPSNMPNTKGVHLTIGVVVNGDRMSMVMCEVCDASGLDKVNTCEDAVTSALSTLLPILLPCLAPGAYISYVQAEGMVDGMVPYRLDFGPTEHPGTGTSGDTMPSQVAGLLIFYGDPDDAVEGDRMKFAKTFVPGLPKADVSGDIVNSPTSSALVSLANMLQEGFVSSAFPPSKWWRVIAPPRIPATPPKTGTVPAPDGTYVIRTRTSLARFYLATQRRRQLPH